MCEWRQIEKSVRESYAMKQFLSTGCLVNTVTGSFAVLKADGQMGRG